MQPIGLESCLCARKPADIVGPYAPAILRFLVSFPSVYPESPPSITLVTDIFHPLVTPLTTYTYTNGSPSADTVSAADEERLPPGGFGLSDGFPQWFGGPEQSTPSLEHLSRNVSGSYDEDDTPNRGTPPSQYTGRRPLWGHGESRPSIIDVLEYVKRAFDDEGVLDRLPFEAAVNPGAWKAWRAHRRDAVQDAGNSGSLHDRLSAERRHESRHTTPREIKRPDEWSWDGVWKERVKKGVEASMSNHVLFGPGGDDIVALPIPSVEFVTDIPRID
ncbi:MAG: hypothetical protein Q9197_000435 [Variospora fuerteventurae]